MFLRPVHHSYLFSKSAFLTCPLRSFFPNLSCFSIQLFLLPFLFSHSLWWKDSEFFQFFESFLKSGSKMDGYWNQVISNVNWSQQMGTVGWEGADIWDPLPPGKSVLLGPVWNRQGFGEYLTVMWLEALTWFTDVGAMRGWYVLECCQNSSALSSVFSFWCYVIGDMYINIRH